MKSLFKSVFTLYFITVPTVIFKWIGFHLNNFLKFIRELVSDEYDNASSVKFINLGTWLIASFLFIMETIRSNWNIHSDHLTQYLGYGVIGYGGGKYLDYKNNVTKYTSNTNSASNASNVNQSVNYQTNKPVSPSTPMTNTSSTYTNKVDVNSLGEGD